MRCLKLKDVQLLAQSSLKDWISLLESLINMETKPAQEQVFQVSLEPSEKL